MKDKYLTLEEVAKRLKVNKATVYRMARKRQIPAFKFGKVWRIDTTKLDEMIERNIDE